MKKLKFREMLTYGVGAIGLDLSYGLFYSYLSKYLQGVLNIKSSFLLIIAPLARLWDGINDPLMGTLVDHTKTRFGKYRPWIVTGAVCNAVVLYFLFNNPGLKIGSVSLYVYVAVFYVLWGMTNTLADIPYWSMIPSFTSDPKQRNMISTVARTFSGLGQGLVIIFTPIMLKTLGDGTNENINAQGFGRWALICGIFLIIFAVTCFMTTRERRVIKSEDSFSFSNALKTIKSNDQLLIFMLFAMLSNAGFYITSGISSYFFVDVQHDLSLQSKFNMFGTVGSVLGLLVIPVCSQKFKMSNKKIYQLSLSTVIAGYIIMFMSYSVFSANIVLMGLGYLLCSIGTGSMFVNQTIMLADCVDYGEYKTGKRSESLTFSMKGFLQKMAYTVQCIIMYSSFLFTGYKEGTSIQTKSAEGAIVAMMFIVPPILMGISLYVFSKKYKIHGEFKDEVLNSIQSKYE